MKKMIWMIGILAMVVTTSYAKSNNKSLVKYDKALVSKYLNELEHYSANQLDIMEFVYQASRSDDLSYTMAAVCMEESTAGKYIFNLTGDYGIVGINIKSYMRNNRIKVNLYSKVALATKLMRNDAYALHIGLTLMKYWVKRYKGDYVKAWGSYNGGTIPNYYYANRIYNRIKAIKIFNLKHPYMFDSILD